MNDGISLVILAGAAALLIIIGAFSKHEITLSPTDIQNIMVAQEYCADYKSVNVIYMSSSTARITVTCESGKVIKNVVPR